MTDKAEGADIPYIWHSEDAWNHHRFTMRAQYYAILYPLRAYGQGAIVDGAIEELMKLDDLSTQWARGKDIPVMVRTEPNEYNADD